MFRMLLDGFDEERRELAGRVGELRTCLASAVNDIQLLREENRRLLQAAGEQQQTAPRRIDSITARFQLDSGLPPDDAARQ